MVEDPRKVPQMVLATVSTGEEHAILYPEQVWDFLSLHWDFDYVGQNIAFDYHVLHKALPEAGQDFLESLVDENRLHDTMLMDQLLQLTTQGSGSDEDGSFRARNLDLIGQDYAGLRTPKDDPYRMRYSEIYGKNFAEVDPGFLDYAIGDSVVTWRSWQEMVRRAKASQASHMANPITGREVYEDSPRRFGWLSEAIQVKAAIVLHGVTKRGIRISEERVLAAEEKLRADMEQRVEWLRTYYPQLLDFYKIKSRAGELKVNKGTGVPHLKLKELRVILEGLVQELGLRARRTPKTGEVVASVGVWRSLLPDHPLIQTWTSLADTGKLLQFTAQVKDKGSAHPSYKTLVRTGRTSSYKGSHGLGLNIQQMPREAWFREIFIPRPGHKLVAIDYSFIELRTLASVCYAKYGKSVLGDVIRDGVDPHAYTAALVMGIDPKTFMALKGTDPETFKNQRQSAKAVNFGVPGGLGAQKLSEYAKANYGVEMDPHQAGRLKTKLITEIYPELSDYLSDNSLGDLAANLKVNKEVLRKELRLDDDGRVVQAIRKIVGGRAFKADGTPYNQHWVAWVWQTLEGILRNDTPSFVVNSVALREGSSVLEDVLFNRKVATLTGRIRSGVGYTEARNTPFQGLAADGAKLALWELHREGIPIVAFVHDEIVMEVAEKDYESSVKRAEELMNRGMSEVLFPGVQSVCESAVGNHWIKP